MVVVAAAAMAATGAALAVAVAGAERGVGVMVGVVGRGDSAASIIVSRDISRCKSAIWR